MPGGNYWEKMQQHNINNKLDNFCNELENLSSLMVHSFTLGDYNIIKTIDSKRKLILEEISKDINTLSNSNKKKLKLIWVNNNKLIKKFEKKMQLNKKEVVSKKKLFLAYSKNSVV